MIQDVDDTLRELLVKKAGITPADIDIRFEMPNKEWSATVTKPTINLYLYDLRENHELRSVERTLTRNGGIDGTLTRAPVRMDLSYLITAWATEIADEHALLGRVLVNLLQFPVVPTDVLKGAMQTQSFPLKTWISQPERLPSPWEFWGHMDHGMKAGINFVLTTSLEPFPAESVQLATKMIINLDSIGS